MFNAGKCLLILTFVGIEIHCAVYIRPPTEKPQKYENEIGCYSPEIDEVMPYNSTAQLPKKCIQIFCYNDGTIQGHSCGTVQIDEDNPNCHYIEQDFSKPYPACCKSAYCEPSESNGSQQSMKDPQPGSEDTESDADDLQDNSSTDEK